MFERFTDQARRVVVHAQEEARLLKHKPWISGVVSRFAPGWRTFGNLERIDSLLARIERRLGINTPERPPRLRQLDERLTVLRAQLETAIDQGEFERARELRDQERRARVELDMSENDWGVSEAPVGSVFEELVASRDKLAAAQAELTREFWPAGCRRSACGLLWLRSSSLLVD
jgi:hypothetical protein